MYIVPRIEADAMASIAIQNSAMGNFEESLDRLSNAIQKYEEISSENSNDHSTCYNMAILYHKKASVIITNYDEDTMKSKDVVDLLERALSKFAEADAMKPGLDGVLTGWARANCDLANFLLENYEEASEELSIKIEKHWNDGIALYERCLHGNNDAKEDPTFFFHYGSSMSSFAVTLKKKGHLISEEFSRKFGNLASKSISMLERCKSMEGDENNRDTSVQLGCAYMIGYSEAMNVDLLSKAESIFHGIENEKKGKCLNRSILINHVLIFAGEGAYNLACICSLREDEENTKKWLEICKEKDTLPSKKHVMKDPDLNFVRDKEWFANIVS
jgi:hypothetical protein